MISLRCTAALLLGALAAAGCSSRGAYEVGQAWQRGQCERMPDEGGRGQCVSGTSTSYDSYKRQSAGSLDK